MYDYEDYGMDDDFGLDSEDMKLLDEILKDVPEEEIQMEFIPDDAEFDEFDEIDEVEMTNDTEVEEIIKEDFMVFERLPTEPVLEKEELPLQEPKEVIHKGQLTFKF